MNAPIATGKIITKVPQVRTMQKFMTAIAVRAIIDLLDPILIPAVFSEPGGVIDSVIEFGGYNSEEYLTARKWIVNDFSEFARWMQFTQMYSGKSLHRIYEFAVKIDERRNEILKRLSRKNSSWNRVKKHCVFRGMKEKIIERSTMRYYWYQDERNLKGIKGIVQKLKKYKKEGV